MSQPSKQKHNTGSGSASKLVPLKAEPCPGVEKAIQDMIPYSKRSVCYRDYWKQSTRKRLSSLSALPWFHRIETILWAAHGKHGVELKSLCNFTSGLGGVVSQSRRREKEEYTIEPSWSSGHKEQLYPHWCVFAKNIRAAGAPELTRACFRVDWTTLTT